MIELVIVIVIMAVLASIAIPAFSVWLPNYRLRSAARDLYSNLQLAKLGAVKQNTSWAVVFDQGVTPGRYCIVSNPGSDGNWDGFGHDAEETVERTVDLTRYEDIDFGHGTVSTDIVGNPFSAGDDVVYGASDAVVFNARGTCNGGYVYLSNNRNTTYGTGTRTSGVILLRKWTGSAWE